MTETAPAPPKTPKAAATRRRLLTEAHRLFIKRGYHAVSLTDIAEAADLTKGAIYGHFRSKGQLLVEVIRTELAERDEQAQGAETQVRPDEMIRVFVAEGARELRLLQVDAAAAARHDEDVADGMAQLVDSRLSWIAELSSSARSNRKAEAVDAEAVAFVITALAQGIGTLEAEGVQPPDPDRFAATVWPMIMAAMK